MTYKINNAIAVFDDGVFVIAVKEIGGRIAVTWKRHGEYAHTSIACPLAVDGEIPSFGMGFPVNMKPYLFKDADGLVPEWDRFVERLEEHWNMPDLTVFDVDDRMLGKATGDENITVIPMRC